VRPKDGPGWEHLLFSVVANVLISICAFVSIVLLFKSRTVLQKPAAVLQRTQESTAKGAASPTPGFNRLQRSLRTNGQPGAEPQTAGVVTHRRSALRRRGEKGRQTGTPLDLHLADGHVEPA
jgi:hypothetical protein